MYLCLVYIAQMDCSRFQTNSLLTQAVFIWPAILKLLKSCRNRDIYKGYCSLMISKSVSPFLTPKFFLSSRNSLLKLEIASPPPFIFLCCEIYIYKEQCILGGSERILMWPNFWCRKKKMIEVCC